MTVTRCILICQSAETNENSKNIKAQIEKVLRGLPVEETDYFRLCWMPQFQWQSLEQANITSWSSKIEHREKDKEYLYIHDALDYLLSLLDIIDEVRLEVVWISDGMWTFEETNESAVYTYGALLRARNDFKARIHIVNSNDKGVGNAELKTWAEDLGTGKMFKMEELRTLIDPMIIWRGPIHFSRLCPAHLSASKRDPMFLNNQHPRSSPSNMRKPSSPPGCSQPFPSSTGLPRTSSSRTLPSSDRGSYQYSDEVWLSDFFLSRHPISIGNERSHTLWFNKFCFGKVIGTYDLRDIPRHLLHPDFVYKLGCLRGPGTKVLQYLISSQSEEHSICFLLELKQTDQKRSSNPGTNTKTYTQWLAALEIAKTVEPDAKLDQKPVWEASAVYKPGLKLLIYANKGNVFAQQMLRMEELEVLGKIWMSSKPTIHPKLIVMEEQEEKEAHQAVAAAVPRRSRRKGTISISRYKSNLAKRLPKSVYLSDLLGELPLVAFDAIASDKRGALHEMQEDHPKTIDDTTGLSSKNTTEFIMSCIIPTPEEWKIKTKAIVEETLNLGVFAMEKEKLGEIREMRKRSFSQMMKFYAAEPLLGARSSSAPTAKQRHEESIRLTLNCKRKRRRKLAKLKKKKNGMRKPAIRGQSKPSGYKPSRIQAHAPVPRAGRWKISKANANTTKGRAYKENCKNIFTLLTKELKKRHGQLEPDWRKRRDFCYKQIKGLIEQKKPEFYKTKLKKETLGKYLAVLLKRVVPTYDLEF